MVLDKPIAEIIAKLGHDGSEILYPDLGEPLKRRSFSIQEIIDIVLVFYGYALVPIDACPHSGPTEDRTTAVYKIDAARARFLYYLEMRGIMIGVNRNRIRHAVAWDPDTSRIYDPNGTIYGIDKLMVESLWIPFRINKINNHII